MTVILRRELSSYFATPVAYIFILFFLFFSCGLPLLDRVGNFFPTGQANLQAFFSLVPFIFLFLIPAISMRLWSEERESGTIELLLTLPVTMMQAMMGKFLAAWLFAGFALACTFPLWITVNYLGDPDNGVIITSYVGAFLMAGTYLAIGACISALTKSQAIAYVVTAFVCTIFTIFGASMLVDFFGAILPDAILDALTASSFSTRFEAFTRGVIAASDIIFFLTTMAFWLLAGAVAIDARKAH